MNKRFFELRKFLKLSLIEMGKKIGKGKSIVQYYESGKQPITDGILLRLNEVFNVNINWMRTGEGDMFNSSNTDNSIPATIDTNNATTFTNVSYYPDIYASAGTGCTIPTERCELIQLNTNTYKPTKSSAIINVHGDSMMPTLQHNDKILIDTNIHAEPLKLNNLYAINHQGELFVKRLKYTDNNIAILTSDNINFNDITINKNDFVKIIGIVRTIIYRDMILN